MGVSSVSVWVLRSDEETLRVDRYQCGLIQSGNDNDNDRNCYGLQCNNHQRC